MALRNPGLRLPAAIWPQQSQIPSFLQVDDWFFEIVASATDLAKSGGGDDDCLDSLVGYGDIGKSTAMRLLAAGMNIIAYDPVALDIPELTTVQPGRHWH